MKAFNRILGVVVMFSVVVIFVVGVQHGTAKPNMEECNPQEMGRLESAMWRSYYDRQWPQLVGLTFEGACGQFGFSWWDAARLSLYAGRAAMFFRDKTDDPRCEPALVKYFAIVRKSTDRDFDIHKASELELGWWKARRRSVAPRDYAKLIAQQASLITGAPEEELLPACRIRTEAMAYLESRPGGKMTDSDWQEISRKLNLAYVGMRAAAAEGQ